MATTMALRSGHICFMGVRVGAARCVGKLQRRSRRDGALQVDIDAEVEVAVAGQPKKRTFRKDSYRSVDLNVLLDMSTNDLSSSYPSVPAEVAISTYQFIRLKFKCMVLLLLVSAYIVMVTALQLRRRSQ
ncbi:uncharacterized protein LOC8077422 isoform X2 [Sorghum bicolor]|uniref:Uncharacterized protein n=1 Tax=Sorghum bicolor TaxID=4558 RepID=C5XJ95_SORBI|nr:uncharacterized protein LOC8077422 isoform X2 [Sorghum bicolor]EES04280.2 hypothetical protein SORBI_3003G439900 [Sorghum bicolor]|eukprot:XP_021311191.1 uncharacterized protein LOC8077422 isoform X2 [Sorghum bicolor]